LKALDLAYSVIMKHGPTNDAIISLNLEKIALDDDWEVRVKVVKIMEFVAISNPIIEVIHIPFLFCNLVVYIFIA
jgi:hypothetical protein